MIVGFDFAPLVYENEETGKLEVDLGLVNDVREQQNGHGEDLVKGSTSVEGLESSVMPLPLPFQRGSEPIRGGNFSRGTSSVFTKSSAVH